MRTCPRCGFRKDMDQFHDRQAACIECCRLRKANRPDGHSESAEEYAGRIWLWLGAPIWLEKPGVELLDVDA